MSARFLAGALHPGPAARSPTSMLRAWRHLSRAAMNWASATVASGYDHQRHCAGSPRTEARSTAQTGNAIECLCEFWRASSGPTHTPTITDDGELRIRLHRYNWRRPHAGIGPAAGKQIHRHAFEIFNLPVM